MPANLPYGFITHFKSTRHKRKVHSLFGRKALEWCPNMHLLREQKNQSEEISTYMFKLWEVLQCHCWDSFSQFKSATIQMVYGHINHAIRQEGTFLNAAVTRNFREQKYGMVASDEDS